MKIKKAIITAGGRGTRFLPAVKAYQKEMIPVMNKPQIQWVIEEAIESGITDIAVICREGVNTFAKYLENDDELWKFLKETGKESLMDSWVELKSKASITILEQKLSDPYGNGTPFLIAKDWTNGEPVVGMWGDDLIIHTDKSKPTCTTQMIDYYEKYSPVAVMSVLEVPESEISRYGSYGYYDKTESNIPYHAKLLVEKPTVEEAPSLYANACRFVLSPLVFEELSLGIKGKGGELWLTDAVNRLIEKGEVVIAAPWEGNTWVTTGDPLRWLKANIETVIKSGYYEEEKEDLIRFMKEQISSH